MSSSSNPMMTDFKQKARVYLQSKSAVLRVCEQSIKDEILGRVIAGSPRFVPLFRDKHSTSILTSLSLITCDFLNMELTDGETSAEENIIIDVPWSPETLSFLVSQRNDRGVKQQVLVMALQRFRRVPILQKLLAAKRVPTSQIWANPHLRPGHVPFDNFGTSLLDWFETRDSKEADHLFALILEMADENEEKSHDEDTLDDRLDQLKQGGIQLVFHGTNHKVMDDILLSGLDPQLRRSHPVGDYFGVDFNISLGYSKSNTPDRKGPLKLLFFMILASGNDGLQIMVEDTKLELPLAKVAVEIEESDVSVSVHH